MMLRKTLQLGHVAHVPLLASMRPEHDAPENEVLEARHNGLESASMRPEHDAPENHAHRLADDVLQRRFNEAGA